MRFQKWTTEICVLLIICTLGLACQSEEFGKNYIDIKMLASFEEPSYLGSGETCNAEWFEPISQSYSLIGVNMTYSDPTLGGELQNVDLLAGENSSFRIANRTQRIFRKEISESSLGFDLAKKTVHSLKITFDNKVTSLTKNSDSLETTLGSSPSAGGACTYTDLNPCLSDDQDGQCSVLFNEGFTAITGQGYTFVIKVKWKRTVERNEDTDTKVVSPTMGISVSRT